MSNKLMIDCETLDIGERPVLLSIGAVVFDDNGIWRYFHVLIEPEHQKEKGFTVSQSTLDWWKQQDPEAQRTAFNGLHDLEDALRALVRFYRNNSCTEIWSKGALADIRWINNALDYFEIEHPWEYYKEFCFRTLLKSVPKFEIPFTGTPHNALDDAIHQAKQFIHIKAGQKERDQVLNKKCQCQIFNEMAEKMADLEFQLLQEKGV